MRTMRMTMKNMRKTVRYSTKKMNSVIQTGVISSVCQLLNWEDQALMMTGLIKHQT